MCRSLFFSLVAILIVLFSMPLLAGPEPCKNGQAMMISVLHVVHPGLEGKGKHTGESFESCHLGDSGRIGMKTMPRIETDNFEGHDHEPTPCI